MYIKSSPRDPFSTTKQDILNHKLWILNYYPHAVEWRKHLGFILPSSRNSKKEFKHENKIIRRHILSIMKKWCKTKIPKDVVKRFVCDAAPSWCFFENKFRFKLENHKMAFIMEFYRKGNDLKKEAKELIAKEHIQIKSK